MLVETGDLCERLRKTAKELRRRAEARSISWSDNRFVPPSWDGSWAGERAFVDSTANSPGSAGCPRRLLRCCGYGGTNREHLDTVSVRVEDEHRIAPRPLGNIDA